MCKGYFYNLKKEVKIVKCKKLKKVIKTFIFITDTLMVIFLMGYIFYAIMFLLLLAIAPILIITNLIIFKLLYLMIIHFILYTIIDYISKKKQYSSIYFFSLLFIIILFANLWLIWKHVVSAKSQ